jgi:hypothetical protein
VAEEGIRAFDPQPDLAVPTKRVATRTLRLIQPAVKGLSQMRNLAA